MMDRIDALQLFVRVAETGAFSRAARDAGISQPAASRAIASLETEFGARLLHRSTRRLSVTAAGEACYARAKKLVEEYAALANGALHDEQDHAGLVRVSASTAFSDHELARLAPRFLMRHPAVRLDFVASDARIDLVAEGIDIVFRLGDNPPSSLVARRLGLYRRILVAAPAAFAECTAPDTPESLDRHPRIAFLGTAAADQWDLRCNSETARIPVVGSVRAASGSLVAELTRQGLGIALLPDFLVRDDLARGSLIRVLPQWSGPPLPLSAMWAGGRPLPPRVRAWLEFVASGLSFDAAE